LSDAVWPISLPQAPITRALEVSPPDLLVRSSMDVGPAKVRRRATVGVTVFAIEMAMTATQLATFETFWRDTVLGGALTFDFKNPQTGAAAAEMRFADTPSWSPKAPRTGSEYWSVRFRLELLPSADAIVVGGGGVDHATGGAWFQPPMPGWEPPQADAPIDWDWGGAGVFEDPIAAPDGLLWQVGAEAENYGDDGSDSGGAGGAVDGGGGEGGMQAPVAGHGSAQGSGDGQISTP